MSAPTIKLRSSDNVEIPVERDVAKRSVLIKNMMDDIGELATSEAIPIPNVMNNLLQLEAIVHADFLILG